MENDRSVVTWINSNPSRAEMTFFAFVWGVMGAMSFYLFDSFVYPLIGDPAPEEWRRPVATSIFFGGLAFVGALFWTVAGSYLEEHFPELREDPNRKKTTVVALVLGGTSTLLLYLFDTFALPLIGGDSLSAEWEQPVIAWILIGTVLFDVALYWGGVRRVVEERFSGFRGDSE